MGSVYEIVGRFAVWAVMGIFLGIWTWHSAKSQGRKKVSRNKLIVRTGIFWLVMIFLAVLLWRMW